MPRIGRFPPFGKRFFRRARKLVELCHFAHFWWAVTGLAAMQARRSLRKLEAACRNHRSRQSVGFFLSKAQWDAPGVLAETALDMLKTFGWKAGMPVDLLFDDTQKKKRGRQMDAVSKIFLHAEKVYAQGHTILGCALVYRGVVIPYAVRLWAPKTFCAKTHQRSYGGESIEFRKLTEMVGETIADFPLSKATAMFDAYYLCPTVTQACEAKRYHYVGVAKKNCNFLPDGREAEIFAARDRKLADARERRKVQRQAARLEAVA